jgi:predicted HNH restriction endonuclease
MGSLSDPGRVCHLRGYSRTTSRSVSEELKRSAILEEPSRYEDDADEEFVEGKILTARHRKRDQRLRSRLIAKRRGAGLRCELCGFTAAELPSSVEDAFFEAHHKLPLAAAEGERRTKVEDMALFCACCHRFIHRLIAREKRWFSTDEAIAWRREIRDSGSRTEGIACRQSKPLARYELTAPIRTASLWFYTIDEF